MFLKTWLPDFESTFPHKNAWYSLNIRRFCNYFCISDFLEKRMIGLSTLLQIPPSFCRLRAHRKSLFFVYCSAVFVPTPGQITICIFTLRHHRATGQQNRHAGTEKAALRRNSPPGAWRPRQWIWNAAASVAGQELFVRANGLRFWKAAWHGFLMDIRQPRLGILWAGASV